jgi:hypothetical protein
MLKLMFGNPATTSISLPVQKKRLALFLVLIFTGSMWFYLTDIGLRERRLHPSPDEVKDTHGDLFAPWYGARELLVNHRDPYSLEVTREIQNEYYGKALTGALHEPKDQQRFAYPAHLVFLFLPFVRMPFNTVRIIFYCLLPAITLATIPAWLRLIGVRSSVFLFTVIAAFACTSVPVFRGLNLQQLTLFVAGLLAACAVSLVNGRYVLAGIFLALASIKPQMSILLSVWLILWAISNWKERKRFFWSFLITVTVLLSAAECILPGWIGKFLNGAAAYRQYAAGGNLSEFYLPGFVSLLLAGLVFIMMSAAGWYTRREPCGSLGFAFAFCTILAGSIFVVPALSAVFNQVLLLPALLLPLRTGERTWARNARSRIALQLFAAAALLPWACAIITVLVWALLPVAVLHRIWGLPLYGWFALPFAALGFLVFMLKDVLREIRTASTTSVATEQ